MADDVWLTQEDWAQRAGLKNARQVGTWRAEGRPKHNPIPPPDDVVIDKGHARPRWREATYLAWEARRPGRGRRLGDQEKPATAEG